MLSKLSKGQVVAFVIATLIAITYASVVYVKLPRQLGFGRYEVAVDLANTADLYKSAAVTLRGEEIGEVERMQMTQSGVRATLWINDGTAIPVDSVAQIRSISALGEQYVNFEPHSFGGPVLRDGDLVPVSKVQLPVQETELLDKVDALVASLPAADLNTTIDETARGFGNTGSDIQRLIDSTDALVATADANISPTRELIDDLGPVLDTQRRLGPQTRAITGDLAKFTGQLRASDSDLRGTIEKVPDLVRPLDSLVKDLRQTLPGLLHDLTDVGEVVRVYLPNARQVLLTLPITNAEVQTAIYGLPIPYGANLNFKAVLNNPPACQTGFINDGRNINDFSPKGPAYDAFCKELKTSAIGVRTGRNDPCPDSKWASRNWDDHPDGRHFDGDVPEFGPTDPAAKADYPRSNDAYGCGLHFQNRADFLRSRDDATHTMLDVARDFPTTAEQPKDAPPFKPLGAPSIPASATPSPSAKSAPQAFNLPMPTPTSHYDSRTGVFLAPDGQPYILGTRPGQGPKPGTPAASDWRTLLLDPMGQAPR